MLYDYYWMNTLASLEVLVCHAVLEKEQSKLNKYAFPKFEFEYTSPRSPCGPTSPGAPLNPCIPCSPGGPFEI